MRRIWKINGTVVYGVRSHFLTNGKGICFESKIHESIESFKFGRILPARYFYDLRLFEQQYAGGTAAERARKAASGKSSIENREFHSQ